MSYEICFEYFERSYAVIAFYGDPKKYRNLYPAFMYLSMTPIACCYGNDQLLLRALGSFPSLYEKNESTCSAKNYSRLRYWASTCPAAVGELFLNGDDFCDFLFIRSAEM